MKPDFKKYLTRKYSVLMDDIIIRSWLDGKRFSRLTGIRECMKSVEIIDGAFCLDKNWMDFIHKKYGRKKLDFFTCFCKKGYIHGEKVKNFVRNINLHKIQKETERDFWRSLDLLENLIVFVAVTHPLAKIIEDKVRVILARKGISKIKFEEILIQITQPKRLNTPLLEQIDLAKMRKKQRDPKFNLNRALEKHFEKYSFLGYRQPFSSGFDIGFFKRRLKEKEIIQIQEKVDIKFTREEQKKIDIMRGMVFFRNYRTEKMVEAFYYLEKLWNKIGDFYGLTKNELAHYRISEVKNLFEKGTKVREDAIKSREKAHGYLVHDTKAELILGKKLGTKINEYNIVEKDISEIKGSTACRGIARGVVKVVLDSREQEKVSRGDILVTTMTTPDFLSSMRRAAAFLTDEGGITCHAAIIAREMKKPCIIGTKIATQVLRDGDFVEVDADNGVVKIIKKVKR
jgi:phosphohistidine swiveling domain-containing protein